jgi:hypothetical protein
MFDLMLIRFKNVIKSTYLQNRSVIHCWIWRSGIFFQIEINNLALTSAVNNNSVLNIEGSYGLRVAIAAQILSIGVLAVNALRVWKV